MSRILRLESVPVYIAGLHPPVPSYPPADLCKSASAWPSSLPVCAWLVWVGRFCPCTPGGGLKTALANSASRRVIYSYNINVFVHCWFCIMLIIARNINYLFTYSRLRKTLQWEIAHTRTYSLCSDTYISIKGEPYSESLTGRKDVANKPPTSRAAPCWNYYA